MSEHEETIKINGRPADSLSNFYGADFQKHLDEKNAERPCEACGCPDWLMNCDEKGRPMLVKMDLLQQDDLMHLYVPLLCKRCGNTRFYNVGWVLSDVTAGEGDKS
ncbi:hypothetical protein [Pseudomonas oryzihabitans]|uniref:hypothetical protein n=1 Tax=Pseudomonas oryzihabitans TaxID=47885 RepID=UPI0011A3A85F|nr:hypothetical protein [Pseudomonas oryzihabitans]